jgi:hypothetical protein
MELFLRKTSFNFFPTSDLRQVDRGMRDVLQCDDLFDCKPAVQRAFHLAKKASNSRDRQASDFIEFREFRLFLHTLRQYFEYYQAFARYKGFQTF